MNTYKIKTFKVELVVSDIVPDTTTGPKETAAILRAIYAGLDADQEHFLVTV